MQFVMGILRNLFGAQPNNNARNQDSLDQRKEDFFANYPVNPVPLPNESARGVIIDESPSTQENVKVGQTVMNHKYPKKNGNHGEARDKMISSEQSNSNKPKL